MKKIKDLLKQWPLECQRGVKIISKATTQHSDERVTQIHHDWAQSLAQKSIFQN